MAGAPLPVLHELERKVMEELWDRGEATVRTVRDALNDRSDRERAYTTVMTVMSRLHRKGLLDKQRRGRSDRYVPSLTREEYLNSRAGQEVDMLVAAYGDVALAHFAARVARLDPDRRHKLQRLQQRD